MGSKKSSSSSSTNTTNQYDQRSITTIDDRDTSTSTSLDWDMSNRSTNNYDASNRSTTSLDWDMSNRSTNNYSSTTSISNVDASAINKQNAELLRGLGANQTDATKAVAQMQASGLQAIGGAFTDVSKVASNNAAAAWTHTIDAGEALLSKVVDATNASSDSARLVAQAAISSFQPTDNKQADGFKYAAIAAAAVGALVLMRKA